MRAAGLKLEPGNYSVRPADGTSAHLALDCDGRTQPFVLDLSNTTLVMQACPPLGGALRAPGVQSTSPTDVGV